MSEYIREVADRYTELMAPAFLEGLEEGMPEHESLLDPSLRIHLLQPPIRQRLEDVDWGGSGLPNKQWDGDEFSLKPKDLDPQSYAMRLMAFAFDDAYQLMKLGETYAAEKGLPKDANLRDTLLNSNKTLLRVALLPDPIKNDIYRGLRYPDLLQYDLGMPAFDAPEDMFRISQDTEGNFRFEWQADIEAYISGNIDEYRGCPAHRKIITEPDGQKQTLLNHFWERVVRRAYT